MENNYINVLKLIQNNRKSAQGYMINKDRLRIFYEGLSKVTIANGHAITQFDPYILKAILEKEKELINRAFELEELDYLEVEKKAKIEAASILTGIDLIEE